MPRISAPATELGEHIDWALLRPIIEKSSEAYAKEKGLPIRTSENSPVVN